MNINLWMSSVELLTLCTEQYIFMMVGKLQMVAEPAVSLPMAGSLVSASKQREFDVHVLMLQFQLNFV